MSDTFVKQLREILSRTFNYTEERLEKIVSFLSVYKRGQWIYPGMLKRDLHIPIEDSYKILEALVSGGFLEGWYEFNCCNCQRTLGTVRYFNELPTVLNCEFCNLNMNTMENTVKIYKVV